jgi:hypothetical protein
MPIMCDGSNFSNGNKKPVALVRMVKSRKSGQSRHPPGAEKPERYDNPRSDRDQADDHVHHGESR